MRLAPVVVASSLVLAAWRSETVDRDPNADLPRRSLAEARAALPEPSVERAFVFDGDATDSFGIEGRVRTVAEAGTYGGHPAWFVLQETEEKRPRSPRTSRLVRRTAWLAHDLFILRSDLVDGDDFHETAVADVAGAVVTTTRGGTTDVTAMTQPLDGLATLAGALLFFRLCPPERAAYGEPLLCPCVVEVNDRGMQCRTPTKGGLATIWLDGPDRAPSAIDRQADEFGFVRARPPAVK